MSSHPSRRQLGERIEPQELVTLSHGEITIPRGPFTHLMFRRFAGCPICNLHLRHFAQGNERLQSRGIEVVAFFHSSADAMRPYQGSLPFPAVPDPDRIFYRQFGVESSFGAVLHPQAAWAMVKGLAQPSANPLAGGPNPNGLPADFLLDESGTLVDVKYGRHADDHWSVEEVLSKASSP